MTYNNTHRIIITETVLFNGNMVDRQFSTKWMTKEEAEERFNRLGYNDRAVIVGRDQ